MRAIPTEDQHSWWLRANWLRRCGRCQINKQIPTERDDSRFIDKLTSLIKRDVHKFAQSLRLLTGKMADDQFEQVRNLVMDRYALDATIHSLLKCLKRTLDLVERRILPNQVLMQLLHLAVSTPSFFFPLHSTGNDVVNFLGTHSNFERSIHCTQPENWVRTWRTWPFWQPVAQPYNVVVDQPYFLLPWSSVEFNTLE